MGHWHSLALWLTMISVSSNHFSQAQLPSFAVPSTWRVECELAPWVLRFIFTQNQKPTTNLSLGQIDGLTRAVVETVNPLFNLSSGLVDALGFGDTANLLCAIISADQANGSTTYREVVIDSVNTALIHVQPIISTTWGLAAIGAAMAYDDPGSMKYAVEVWEQVYVYFVSPADAVAGKHSTRSVYFSSTCQGATTAGGVFWTPGTDQPSTAVNAETVGAFMTLSSHLFNVTSNTTYSTAAELSAEFIWNHLYNGTVILDTINLEHCLFPFNDTTWTYNSGKTIEGLSSLAVSNPSWTSRLQSLVGTSIAYRGWTNQDGVNTEGHQTNISKMLEDDGGSHVLKAYFVRGLYAAWSFTNPTSPMAHYIESYLNVQFNIIQDNATAGSHLYVPDWQGPAIATLLPWGQLDALEVLKAELGFSRSRELDISKVSPAPSNQTQTSDHNAVRRKPTGAMIGGAIGGTTICFLLFGSLIVWVRYHKRQQLGDLVRHKLEVTPLPVMYTGEGSSQDRVASLSCSISPTNRHSSNHSLVSAQGATGHLEDDNISPTGNYIIVVHGVQATEDPPERQIASVSTLIYQLQNILTDLPPRSNNEAPPQYTG